MNDREGYELDLLLAERTFVRAGNFLKEVFDKQHKQLSGEDCMKLFNWYGIKPSQIKLMAISHNFQIDESEFINLLCEQKERDKQIKSYSSDNS
jgi:alanyl-tRNA synthetase